MARPERLEFIRRIEQHRSSRVVCYLTSDRQNADAQMQKDILPRIYEHLVALGSPAHVDVFIFTNGGDTMAAFGLARLLREFASHLGLLIPRVCHSAGTLLAMAANEIVMTKAATLSPFDPSVSTPLNPAIQSAAGLQIVPLSVESLAGFQSLVTDDWSMRGEDATVAAFQALTNKVHPLALGDVFRARQQIALLATTLLRTHRQDKENIDRIVDTLTRRLGSHDYLISRTEAREFLGDTVVVDDALEPMIWELYSDFATDMELGTVFDPSHMPAAPAAPAAAPATTTTTIVNKLALIESGVRGDAAQRHVAVQRARVPGGGEQVAVNVVLSGWETYA